MATVLILEPALEFRALLARAVRDLDCRAVFDPKESADVLLVEPADPDALVWALALKFDKPSLPVVCVSADDDVEIAALLQPVAYLVKPVELDVLEQALARLLETEGATAAA